MKALLFLAAAVASPAGQQFDLVCTGQWRFDISEPYQPHNFTVHINLAAKQWCEDACRTVQPILDVEPTVITLERTSPEEKMRGIIRERYIDRLTGSYVRYQRDFQPGMIDMKGACNEAPFTPQPKPSTLF